MLVNIISQNTPLYLIILKFKKLNTIIIVKKCLIFTLSSHKMAENVQIKKYIRAYKDF